MLKATQPAALNDIEFDALIDEESTLSTETPEYPTEKGYTIGDSIILKPEEVSVTLYLSNTPVTWRDKIGVSVYRVDDVINRLRELYLTKSLVTFRTFRRTWNSMAIVSIAFPRRVDTGTAIEIPLTLKKISIVGSKIVMGVVSEYGQGGSSGTDDGTANTEEVGTEAEDISIACGIGRAVKSAGGLGEYITDLLFPEME